MKKYRLFLEGTFFKYFVDLDFYRNSSKDNIKSKG